jgi:hypothetical protein
MKLNVCIGIVLAAGLAACGQKETAPSNSAAESSGNPLTAPVDYLGSISKAKQSMEARLDTVALRQAIQMFQAQEGRFPRDLNELVAKQYLRSVPPAPAGSRLSYNAANGEVRVVKE